MKISVSLRTASCACLSLLALAVSPALGTAASPGAPTTAQIQDAQTYASHFHVDVNEALRRLDLQREIGVLDDQLRREEAGSYAGLWIEHEPSFRIVVRFTGAQAESRLQSRLTGGPLASLVELRRARLSLAELSVQQHAALEAARAVNTPVDSKLNLFENRVEVSTTDPAALEEMLANSLLELPEAVQVQSTRHLAAPAVLRGGELGSGCTGGFTVRANNGRVGISTAAHCPNDQVYHGLFFPLTQEYFSGPVDAQWHSACGIDDVTNEFETGFGPRACTAARARAQVPVGSFVCKFGWTTFATCGTITSNEFAPSYVPNATESYVVVTNDQIPAVVQPGDSGGPWFSGNDALGITSGYFIETGEAIYMPIDDLAFLGVYVLTSDPGPGCNIIPPKIPTPLELCLDECKQDRNDCLGDPDGPRKSQCTTIYNACVSACRRDFP